MEWISRLNVLQDKITSLLQSVSQLKADNESLNNERAVLQDENNKLKEQITNVQNSTAHYLQERDEIKERVERLIQLIE